MNLDFDSGNNKEDPITKYGRIYAQFDKDALAKEQLKIDQQKVGMLQQQFATEQAANVSKLKAQGMLADNPNISAGELASVDIDTATKVQSLKYSDAKIKDLGKPKELTEAAYKRGIDTVLTRNKPYLQATAGADYLNRMTNAYFGSETTGGILGFGTSSLTEGLDTSSVDSVINFFNRNQDKLGLSKAAYNSTRKEILDGYKQAVREGAKALVHGGTKTTAASSVTPTKTQKQSAQNKKVNQEKIENHQQSVKIQNAFEAPLNPTHSVDGVPAVPSSQSDINDVQDVSQSSNAIQLIGQKLSQLNTMNELDAFAEQVSQNQQKVQPPPSQNDINKVQQMFLLRYEEVNSRQRG